MSFELRHEMAALRALLRHSLGTSRALKFGKNTPRALEVGKNTPRALSRSAKIPLECSQGRQKYFESALEVSKLYLQSALEVSKNTSLSLSRYSLATSLLDEVRHGRNVSFSTRKYPVLVSSSTRN